MKIRLKDIPNTLSVIRILLVFVFVFLFFKVNMYAALLVFLLAGITDIVDGYLARHFNWITDIGKILDPFADKFMQCAVLISFYIKRIIPLWFVIPFFAKEAFTVLIGLIVMKKRQVVVVSKWYGKAAVCLFYATIVLSVVLKDYIGEHIIAKILIFIPAVVFALIALAAYIRHYIGLKNPDSEICNDPKLGKMPGNRIKINSPTERKGGAESTAE